MKISIIVPVGNAEEWKVCEKSIADSINAYDGPVEAELLPCWDLEHRGAWVARNEGLSKATGDWISWVDCDDVVEPTWFPTICRALMETPDCDILVFGINQVQKGKVRRIYSPEEHIEEGEKYARWMISGVGMPHWLWHRVFKKELWDGVFFEGRVKQDYQASIQFLPKVKKVKFIPDCLYRYIRHGHGLSNYTQKMDYDAACQGYLKLIEKLPPDWQYEARRGMGLLLTDVIFHDKNASGMNKYLRPYLWDIFFLKGLSFRFRLKSIIAALMIWK